MQAREAYRKLWEAMRAYRNEARSRVDAFGLLDSLPSPDELDDGCEHCKGLGPRLRGALAKAIERDGWVSVGERLPEDNGYFYLVTCNDRNYCGEAQRWTSYAQWFNGQYVGAIDWRIPDTGYDFPHEIVAWMEMPQPLPAGTKEKANE